jgi:phage terminase large subunit-like protein
MKIVSPITFIDKLVKKNELGQDFRLMDHQREILRLAFAFDQHGRLPWDTIIYSCVKKSGKTTLNGALTLWWAFTQEPPNTLLCVANDLEQSLARVYSTLEGLIKYNPQLRAEAEVQTKTIYLDNGSTVSAISNDYAGAAGSNHGFVSYDELWGVVSENGRRLFEELCSVPTRRNSIRFITTYAGFTGESELLEDLYQKAVIEGERIHPELPIYANREARTFGYWDSEPRMPWQLGREGEQYYAAQRRTLRPATFARLHQNQWVSSESRFIEPQVYDQCVDPGLREDLTGNLFVGVDVGLKSDSTAIVAVKYDRFTDKLIVAGHRIWQPKPGEILDLGSTLEFFIRGLSQRAVIEKVMFDPSQAQRSMQILREGFIEVEELPQTEQNLSQATECLYDHLINRRLRIYPNEDLRSHILNASTKETERVFRLRKESQRKKIDAAVALSFAILAAVRSGRPAASTESGFTHRCENNLDPDFSGFGSDEPPPASGPGNAIRAER